MNNQQDLIADEINIEQVRRIQLIPLWIKIFAWIFLVFGAFAVIVFAIGIMGGSASLSLYGLSTNEPLSIIGIFITACFMLKGIVAFGLIKEKDWAIKLGIADAIIGIAACAFTIIYPFFLNEIQFTFRLELIALIPYLVKLLRIKTQWETNVL